MDATQMIDLMNRTPFAPLEIHLNDGARIRVEQPYHVATRQNSSTFSIYDDGDRMRIVAFRNVTEVITSTAPG